MTKASHTVEVGQRLRERRCGLGLSQLAVAAGTGISQQALSRWELGGRPMSLYHATLLKLYFRQVEREMRAR